MKELVIVGLFAVSSWLPTSVFGGDPCGGAPTAGSSKKPCLIKAAVAPGAAVQLAGDGAEPRAFFVSSVAPAGTDAAADRAWLGVAIDEVPEVLAVQLDTKGRGLLITNVVKDSPADRAGLETHDVLLSLDGQEVELGKDLLASHKPGETASLGLLRRGQRTTVNVVLGNRLEAGSLVWHGDSAPDEEIEERIRTHGRILRKGPGGKWIIKDLKDLGVELPDLGGVLPKSGNRTIQIFVDNGRKSIKSTVDRDGQTLIVEQGGDGKITVTRTDNNGTTTNTYETEDQLRAADAEAAGLLGGSGGDVFWHLSDDGDKDGAMDVEEWKENVAEWRQEMTESLRGAGEEYRRAMEEYHRAFQEMMEHWKVGGFPMGAHTPPLPGAHFSGFGPGAKAGQTIQAMPDGRIEVRTRQGDSELVQVFSDETDLARRNPKLYEKYQQLMSGEE